MEAPGIEINTNNNHNGTKKKRGKSRGIIISRSLSMVQVFLHASGVSSTFDATRSCKIFSTQQGWVKDFLHSLDVLFE